jgi:hypothetical protein
MKDPAQSDFGVTVSESSVLVTFNPTNSHYSFYLLADTADIERHDPVSLSNVTHSGPSGDTADYMSSEVQEMAARVATSAVLRKASPKG